MHLVRIERHLPFLIGSSIILTEARSPIYIGVGADGALLDLARDGAATTGRSRTLLEASMKPCPVDMAAADYAVLTSRCRWPPFDPSPCCAAFKDLACPYAYFFNDNSTDCAVTMFQYIRLYGNYPPGVFYLNCKEGPEGLKCPDNPVVRPSTPSPSPPPLHPGIGYKMRKL